jgi:putative membrane protein
MFIWPVLVIVILLAAVWYAGLDRPVDALQAARPHASGSETLAERYARGEIGRDEYLQKKRDLG